LPVLESLCTTILNFSQNTNIIIKIGDAKERKSMKDLPKIEFVDSSLEISNLLAI